MTPDTMLTDAEILAAEWACARLVARYANLNDAGAWEKLADLYAEDGCFARPAAPTEVVHGRAAILESLRARPLRKSRHICSNIVIDVVSPVEARGECAMALFIEGAEPKVGTFRDRFIRTGQGWRFSERFGSLAY
ncbi:nuclear transport factor 2 family protein [Novosphingobium sp.]|uniref:nuclear transport factor 2 family protein n=1 Tax=Novosphingobium sp. TaxID=1874826 RepID=UPI003B5282F6